MLKSLRTCRVLEVSICGAITSLCMPITNKNTAIQEDNGKGEKAVIMLEIHVLQGNRTHIKLTPL